MRLRVSATISSGMFEPSSIRMNDYVLNSDTICAISTPAGVGGIAVIRVSGNDALSVVARCWQGCDISTAASHTAHLGRIIDPADGSIVDEVVLTIFRTPHSFTGEDTAEISCHGSLWIQQAILNVLITCGCRAATAGEFTRRAFTGGRIDLSQAEAIADLIAASSRAAHRIAINQMRGDFSRELSALRAKLLEFVALMELELDFSEEDVEFADRTKLIDLAVEIEHVIGSLADSFAVGNAILNGVPVAIVGETNAGKSTLLNYFLHDDRAIVSDIHGTTRDSIEDTVTISGTLFRFIDTAGLRNTSDAVETLGIERTMQKIAKARIVLWIIDGTSSNERIVEVGSHIIDKITQDDTTSFGSSDNADKQLIAVINKCDKITPAQTDEIQSALQKILPARTPVIVISAREKVGLDRLTTSITKAAAIPEDNENQVIVTNARHYQALSSARNAISRALTGLRTGVSGDFVSQDIRECMHYLGEITGEITPDNILSEIFSRFCIGK